MKPQDALQSGASPLLPSTVHEKASDALHASGHHKKVLLAHAATITAMSIFGGYNVVAQSALDAGTDPLIFCFFRDIAATLVLGCCCFVRESNLRPQSRQHAALLVLCGVCGIYAGQYLFIVGLDETNSNVAAMFQPLVPIWTVLMEIICRQAALTTKKGIGVFLAVLGAGLMGGLDGLQQGNWDGYLVLLAQTWGVAAYFVLQKPLLRDGLYSPLLVTSWGYAAGTVCIALTALRYVAHRDKFVIHSATTAYALTYSVLCSSCLGFGLMTWANQYIPASIVALYCMVQPVVTALLNLVIHSTGISWTEGVGAGLVMTGLVVTNLSDQSFGSASTDDSESCESVSESGLGDHRGEEAMRSEDPRKESFGPKDTVS